MLRRRTRDVVLRAHVGNLRVAAVMARATIAESARRWGLVQTSERSRLWSEYMAGTVMLSAFFKGDERIKMVLRAPTNEEVYAEAAAVGEVRGKASMFEDSDSATFANSQMQVSKILYGATKPYTTTVAATGKAEVDWQAFYDVSEQVPTRVRIRQTIDNEQVCCSGLTIQMMPDSAPHGRRYDLSDLRFGSVPFSAKDWQENRDIIWYLNELIPGAQLSEEVCQKVPLDFYCRCSKKGFSDRLAGLSPDVLKDMITDSGDDGLELTCHFCNEIYKFSAGDLLAINVPGPSKL